MKKFVIFIILAALCINLHSQEHYYWYWDKKIPLELLPTKKFVLLHSPEDTTQLKSRLTKRDIQFNSFKIDKIPEFESEFMSKKYVCWTTITGKETVPDFADETNILYEAPYLLTKDGVEAGLSHVFYVKLFNAEDTVLLEKMATEYHVAILGHGKYMPALWYTLTCTKESKGNSMHIANLFYESKLFASSVPELMTDDLPACVNDTYFGSQWGLKNTGQSGGTSGIDIKLCDARTVTTGNQNIIVAVLDQGIELNHPDLTNMYPISYDTESESSPSQVLGNHGTACAGIIGATANNNLGVCGIAPNCPLMSISNSLAGNAFSRQIRAAGIEFAYQNGASVISNSWGSGVEYPVINDAIADAVTYGRNGLGCVVVFSSGNDDYSTVNYPGRLSNVIAVGAVDRCGVRSGRIDKIPNSCDPWCSTCSPGSCYGSALSVVAPGTNVPTTDRQGTPGYTPTDYTLTFGGTSAACPHHSRTSQWYLERPNGLWVG